METIVKLFGSLFLSGDDQTMKQRVKDYLLIAFIVEHIIAVALYNWVSEDDEPSVKTEYVQEP